MRLSETEKQPDLKLYTLSGNISKFIENQKEKKMYHYIDFLIFEPPHGKTNNLHRRKQRRRSASR